MISEVIADREYDRLDVFLSEKLDVTRSVAKKLILSGHVECSEDRILKPSMTVPEGSRFTADIPDSPNEDYVPADPVDFDVIYEDEHMFVISKPSGVVVHPAPGNWRNTLVNGLIYRYPEMKKLPDFLRPGIVHRLDAGTSGLMIVARTEKATRALLAMFKARKVKKKYIALIHGTPDKREGILSGPIAVDPENQFRRILAEGGKPSLTGYKVLWSMAGISLVECKLFTGRTHQIRVHMSALGCPLVGDTLYGANDEGLTRVYLHSWRLEFQHPVTGGAMRFRQPVTPDFLVRIANVKAGRPVDFTEGESGIMAEDYSGDFDGEYE